MMHFRLLMAATLMVITAKATLAGTLIYISSEPDRRKVLCNYIFEGEVEKGDAAKLGQLVGYTSSVPDRLCLNSPGGSMAEGLKMFDAIWKHQFETIVTSDARCESACALAWLGGSAQIGTGAFRASLRSVEAGGRLGFHAPSLDLGEGGSYSAAVVEKGFALALQTAQGLFRLQLHNENGAHGMSQFLYHQTLATPPNEMFIIDTVGKALFADITVASLSLPSEKDLGAQEMVNVCAAAWLLNEGVPPNFTTLEALYASLAETELLWNDRVLPLNERVRFIQGEYSTSTLVRGYPRITHNSETVCKVTVSSIGGFDVSLWPMFDQWANFTPKGRPLVRMTLPYLAALDPALPLIARPRPEQPLSTKTKNERFIAKRNYDRPGNDIPGADVKGVSFDQCKEICQSNPNCKAIAHIRSRQWCWPKDGIAQRTSLDGVDSGYFPNR